MSIVPFFGPYGKAAVEVIDQLAQADAHDNSFETTKSHQATRRKPSSLNTFVILCVASLKKTLSSPLFE
jgi:hypothetical protein